MTTNPTFITSRKLILCFTALLTLFVFDAFGQEINLKKEYQSWTSLDQADSNRLKSFKELRDHKHSFGQDDSALYFEFLSRESFALGEELDALNYSALALEFSQLAISLLEGNATGIFESGENESKVIESASSTEVTAPLLIINRKLEYAKLLEYQAELFSHLNQYSDAVYNYKEAIEVRYSLEDTLGVARAHLKIGIAQMNDENLEDGEKHLDSSLRLTHLISELKLEADIYAQYAILSQTNRKLVESGKYLDDEIEIRRAINDSSGLALALVNKAWGQYYMNEFSLADQSASEGMNIAKLFSLIDIHKNALNCLFKANQSRGKFTKSIEYAEELLALTDSANLNEFNTQLTRLKFTTQLLKDSINNVTNESLRQSEKREANKKLTIVLAISVFVLLISIALLSRLSYVNKTKKIIQKERDRSEDLLLNILPSEIAEELKNKGEAEARDHSPVAVIFTDFKGFTSLSEKLSAKDLVAEINHCFKAFDIIMAKYNIEKIKTIGDAYMAVSGIPTSFEDSTKSAALAALEMQEFISQRKKEKDAIGELGFEMRAGIHTGHVVAGIVGVRKFQYDVWGDTVNTASRMETNCEAGRVNISQSSYEQIKNDPEFKFESRGKIEAKGKGEIAMYFVDYSSN
ncbi:MAG: adenylate/guanylate cyclase domain-containing protein [Bacteroidia bacterium]